MLFTEAKLFRTKNVILVTKRIQSLAAACSRSLVKVLKRLMGL
jgi:hypothetical protein